MFKTRIIKLTTAAAIVIAVILGLTIILDYGATPAYAVEQTIKAMEKIKTVHMAVEFYKQGKFECWMKFAGDPDEPTHMWLGKSGYPLCKICSPKGVFGLNRRTNRVHFAKRDERNKPWVIKFGSVFKHAVKKAEKTDSVEIYTEKDPKTEKDVIIVHIKTNKREQKFLVDPETKLPISFSTIRDDAPMEMLRETLVVKNLEWIRYNEQPPEAIFDVPEDAKIVDKEIDCLVYPEAGILANGLTPKQACVKITRIMCQAVIDDDFATLKKYFLLPIPIEVWKMRPKTVPVPVELLGYDEPYQEGEFWYVPCRLKFSNDHVEHTTPMIKFYEFDGKTYCFIVGTKEKGVVD